MRKRRVSTRSIIISFSFVVLVMMGFGIGAVTHVLLREAKDLSEAKEAQLPRHEMTSDLRAAWYLASGAFSETEALALAEKERRRNPENAKVHILLIGRSKSAAARGVLQSAILLSVDTDKWSLENLQPDAIAETLSGKETLAESYRRAGPRGLADAVERGKDIAVDGTATADWEAFFGFAGYSRDATRGGAMVDAIAFFDNLPGLHANLTSADSGGEARAKLVRDAIAWGGAARQKYPGLYTNLLNEFLRISKADIGYRQADLLFAYRF